MPFSTMRLMSQSVLQSLRQDSHMLNSSKGQSLSMDAHTLLLTPLPYTHTLSAWLPAGLDDV